MFCRRAFSGFQHARSKLSPFRPLPVKAVDRRDDRDAEQLRQPQHQARAFRVIMDDIIVPEQGADRRKRGVNNRVQLAAPERRNRQNPDSAVIVPGHALDLLIVFRMQMIAGPVIALHRVSAVAQTSCQFPDDNFNAAFSGRHMLLADHGDACGGFFVFTK